jgi:hypothetical protein
LRFRRWPQKQLQTLCAYRFRNNAFPPRDTFNQNAETIAKTMASKKVRSKGIGSGIRMIQHFINRAGKSLPAARKRELEKAKRILQERARAKKAGTSR